MPFGLQRPAATASVVHQPCAADMEFFRTIATMSEERMRIEARRSKRKMKPFTSLTPTDFQTEEKHGQKHLIGFSCHR